MSGDPRLDVVDAIVGQCRASLVAQAVDQDQTVLRVHFDDDVAQSFRLL